MSHTYKLIEIVGTSETSLDDAIRSGIARAAKTIRHLDWFEVISVRGQIENDSVKYFQVSMKVGFRVLDPADLQQA